MTPIVQIYICIWVPCIENTSELKCRAYNKDFVIHFYPIHGLYTVCIQFPILHNSVSLYWLIPNYYTIMQ